MVSQNLELSYLLIFIFADSLQLLKFYMWNKYLIESQEF